MAYCSGCNSLERELLTLEKQRDRWQAACKAFASKFAAAAVALTRSDSIENTLAEHIEAMQAGDLEALEKALGIKEGSDGG